MPISHIIFSVIKQTLGYIYALKKIFFVVISGYYKLNAAKQFHAFFLHTAIFYLVLVPLSITIISVRINNICCRMPNQFTQIMQFLTLGVKKVYLHFSKRASHPVKLK